jgi:hypothetical protein
VGVKDKMTIMDIVEFIGRFALGYITIHFTLKEIEGLPLENRIVGSVLVFLVILWITIPILKSMVLTNQKSSASDKEKKS